MLTLVGAGFITSANAQRGGHQDGNASSRDYNRGRGGTDERRGGYSQQPSDNRQSRQSSVDRQTSSESRRQYSTPGNRDGFSQRSNTSGNNSSFDRRQTTRNETVFNNATRMNSSMRENDNYRYNGVSGYGYSQRGYSTGGYNYNYAPRRYMYSGAPRYSSLPYGCFSIRFGGYPYYYNSGLFYSYYDGYYEPVFAPIGIRVNILPFGYYPFYLGTNHYYYYDGVYYRSYASNDYEVVDAPLGAQVSTLPKGAKVATVNGEKFYEFNGTYYQESINSKNQVVYSVVGKNGQINNSNNYPSTPLPQDLHVGDVLPNLPDGCKEVTINGEHLYVSPDNIYFRAQSNGSEISYQVVGMQQLNK